ncbi:MAG: hypothetical protein HC910_00160 [Spirulinaceae cyanobacterium SM2_1_0]|nr:hypothetical protein [Spirulinaceae cyanobacterium SM2_1_0]
MKRRAFWLWFGLGLICTLSIWLTVGLRPVMTAPTAPAELAQVADTEQIFTLRQRGDRSSLLCALASSTATTSASPPSLAAWVSLTW